MTWLRRLLARLVDWIERDTRTHSGMAIVIGRAGVAGALGGLLTIGIIGSVAYNQAHPPTTTTTTSTTIGGGGGQGATLVTQPAGTKLCPGGSDNATLNSPNAPASYASLSANIDGNHAANTKVHVTSAAGLASFAANTTYFLDPGQYGSINANQQLKSGDVLYGLYNAASSPPNVVMNGGGTKQFAISGANDYASPTSDTNVAIYYMEITGYGAGNAGTGSSAINQDAQDGWTLKFNYIHDNDGAAIGASGGGGLIAQNCIKGNKEYGVQSFRKECASTPCATQDTAWLLKDVTIDGNEFSGNGTNRTAGDPNWTCGCNADIHMWNNDGFVISDNYIHNGGAQSIFVDSNNRNSQITGNYIADTAGEGIWYETSYNTLIRNNLLVRNTWNHGASSAEGGFPGGAIYISESGSDPRVADPTGTCTSSACTATLQVDHNTMTDNWGGVTVWQDANRFCTSIGNTTTGFCTLVGQPFTNTGGLWSSANKTYCAQGTNAGIGSGTSGPHQPNANDCQWRTQNVKVTHNVMNLTAANVTNCNHTSGHMCGYNALISESGSASLPAGGCTVCNSYSDSPFAGATIENQIVAGATGNLWSTNTYNGTFWCFDWKVQGTSGSYASWVANGQDASGSSNATPNGGC